MKRIGGFILFIVLVNSNVLPQVGPYIRGCAKSHFIPFYQCDSFGYIQAPAELDLCPGDMDTLFAVKPSDPCVDCSFQWWNRYDDYLPGIGFVLVNLRVFGEESNEFIIPESSKDKTYYCKVTRDGNTTSTGSVTVYWNTSEPNIIQDLSSPKLVCKNDLVKLNFPVEGHNSYQWQSAEDDLGPWDDIPGENNDSYWFNASSTDNGPYFRCKSSNSCWENDIYSKILLLMVNDLPTMNDIGNDIHICDGEQLILDAGGKEGNSYLWSTENTDRSITVEEAGTYSVTVTDENNCMNSDTIVVDVDIPIQPVDLKGDRHICLGESVLLDAGIYSNYNWSTGANTRTIRSEETGDYWVEVSMKDNVCRENDTVHIEVAKPFSEEKICLVTVDRSSGKNLIVWEKTPDAGIESYIVYRQTNVAGEYERLDTIPYNELSIYLDKEVNPEVRQWVYKITVVDTCHNESDLVISPYHRPLFLQYTGADEGINLSWEPYVVEGSELEFKTYEIYRGSDITALSKLDEVSGDLRVYKDIDPDALLYKYYYRVAGVVEDPCLPTTGKKLDSTPYSHAFSNEEDNRLQKTGIPYNTEEPELLIYPVPFTHSTTIQFLNPEGLKYRLHVRDLSGKLVYIQDDIYYEKVEFMRNGLPAGIYFVEMIGDKVYRGKLVIE